MSNEPPAAGRHCPHCGKPTGLSVLALLPAPGSDDAFKCRSCGRLFDLSDNTKLFSIFGGILGLAPAVFLFGHFIKGRGGPITAGIGLVMALVSFGLGSIALSWLTLRLKPKR